MDAHLGLQLECPEPCQEGGELVLHHLHLTSTLNRRPPATTTLSLANHQTGSGGLGQHPNLALGCQLPVVGSPVHALLAAAAPQLPAPNCPRIPKPVLPVSPATAAEASRLCRVFVRACSGSG